MSFDWNYRTLHRHAHEAMEGNRWMLTGSAAMHAYGIIARQPNDLNYVMDGFDNEISFVFDRVVASAAHEDSCWRGYRLRVAWGTLG